MHTNGQSEPGAFRADITMRLVIDTPSYAEIGGLMDEIGAMMTALLRRDKVRAEFDFTSFSTHPCKASQMEQAAYPQIAYDRPELDHGPAQSFELTQH